MSNKANIKKGQSGSHNSIYLQVIFGRTSFKIFF